MTKIQSQQNEFEDSMTRTKYTTEQIISHFTRYERKHDKEVEEFHDNLNYDSDKIELLSQIGKEFKQHLLEAQANNCINVITHYGFNILIDRTLLDNTNNQIDKMTPWKIGKFNKYPINELVSQQFMYQEYRHKKRRLN